MLAPHACHVRSAAIIQFLGVMLRLPALILPDFLPGWSVAASLIGIAILPLLGLVIGVALFARTPLDLPLGLLLVLTGINLLTSIYMAPQNVP